MSNTFYEWITPNVECWVWLKYENGVLGGGGAQGNSECGQYFQCVVISIQKEKALAKVKLVCKEEYSNCQISQQAISGQLDVPFEKLMEREIPTEQAITQGYTDMVHMKYLNEAEILNNLRKRYQNNLIFTYIGPTLVVMNPYKDIGGVQGNDVVEQIKSELGIGKDDGIKRNVRNSLSNSMNRPHTYTISGIAYKQMFKNKKNQAIVISGESGAGKTENAKLSMQFLTSLSSGQQSQDDLLSQFKLQTAKNALLEEFNQFAIEVKILACNPILEAFGNAKTVRNNNSSRFGKYVKIYIDKISQKIQGASIDNYLLEKSRIPSPGKGERNYHIFYHMLKGNQELTSLRLSQYKSPSEFEYLRKSECYDVETIQDTKLYLEVKKSFRQMNFTNPEQDAIFSLLSAILLLGNANLDSSKANDTQASTFLNMSLPTHYKEFKNACDLLQVNPKELEESLVFKVRKVGPTIIKSPQSPEECISMRDSLSKNIYDSLFNFLVWKLNQNLLPPQDLKDKCLSIGLLDIFGFESFDVNSFEQLCINFTNEKFQQLYVQYVFKSEEDDYKQEGILDVFANLQYQENQLIIDTIEKKPTGVLVLLDENCSLGSGTDDSFLNSVVKNHSKNQMVSFPKKDKNTFCLSHTAKSVVYSVQGFRDKNKDEVSSEVEKCLSGSTCPTIAQLLNFQQGAPQQQQVQQELPKKTFGGIQSNSIKSNLLNRDFGNTMQANGVGAAKKTVKFLGQKFRQSLQELMVELNTSDVHFVRCIKPNEDKRKDFFKYDYVQQQVQYLGLLDSIKIRKFGYSYRMTYEGFFLEFQELGQKTKALTLQKIQQQKLDLKQLIISEIFEKPKLLQERNLPEKSVAFGKSKLFVKNDVMKVLHEKIQHVVQIRRAYAKKIIVAMQKYLFRKNFHIYLAKIKKKLLKVQSFIRMAIQRKRFLKKRRAVIKMKRLIRIRQLGSGISAFRLNYISFIWDMVSFMIFEKTHLQFAFQMIKYCPKRANKVPVVKAAIVNNSTTSINKPTQQVKNNTPIVNNPINKQNTTDNKQILSIVNEVNSLQDHNSPSHKQQQARQSKNILPQVNFNPQLNRNTNRASNNPWRSTLVQAHQSKVTKESTLQQIEEQKLNDRISQYEKAKEKLKSLIIKFTEYNPAYQYNEMNMEPEIDLEEVPQSEDFQSELDDLIDLEFIKEIKKSEFQSHLSTYLAKRTKWGISQPQEKIMRHQLKPISYPLANLNDLKKIITYEDTREAISIIRSIAQQNSLIVNEPTPGKRTVFYEDAKNNKTGDQNLLKSQQLQQSQMLASTSSTQSNQSTHKLSLQISKSSLMNPRKASVRDTDMIQQIIQRQKSLSKAMKNKKYSPSEKAIIIFKTLLKCAGERKSRFNRHTNIVKLLTLCNEESIDMKEELCKQLSSNDKKESRIKYLKLFAIISSIMPTTSRFYYPLLNFLYTRSMIRFIDQEEQKWYQFCFLRLYKSEQIQRGCIPTDTEVVMIENKKQILIRVYLLNEVPITIGVESYTSINMLKIELLNRLGVTTRPEFFGLMEVRNNMKKRRKEKRFIDENERIMDVIAFWESEQTLFGSQLVPSSSGQNKQVGDIEDFHVQNYQELDGLKIYLSIRVFYSFQENDREAISLFYTQAYSEVLEGKYSPLEEIDYLNLAALQLCIDYPKDVLIQEIAKRESMTVESISPERTQSSFLNSTQNESLLRTNKQSQLEKTDIDEEEEYEQFLQQRNEFNLDPAYYIPSKLLYQKDGEEWQRSILQHVVKNRLLKKESTPSQAKLAYIIYLSKQDLFMSTTFREVKYQRIKHQSLNDTLSSKEKYEQMIQESEKNSAPIRDEILLAINPSNILMCDSLGLNRPKRRVQMRNIQKFCCTENEVIVISHDNTKHIFETPKQCREITFLIRSYLRIFYEKMKSEQGENQ